MKLIHRFQRLRNGVPRQNLLADFRDGVGGIVVSVSDYSNIDPVWQGFLFTDSVTSNTVSASDIHANINTRYVMSSPRGITFYDKTTDADIVSRVAKYHRLSERYVTIAVGNSIAAAARYDSSVNRWSYKSDLQLANVLSGAPMEFGVITPGTYADKYGFYGQGGARLDQINTDVTTDLYDAVDAAGVSPDLVIGHSLLENDIGQGVSYSTCVSRLEIWISTVRARFPNADILICLPRPSFGYDTSAKQTVYAQLTTYINNLSGVYVADVQGYEDPANPGQPLAGYTDASVHPNVRGALVAARGIAAQLSTIIGDVYSSNAVDSTNLTLSGSSTVTGTYTSGTASDSFTPFDYFTATRVATAEDPGQLVEYTVTSDALRKDLGAENAGALSLSSPATIYPFAIIEIVSGAENLSFCSLEPRVLDAGGNTFQNYITMTSGDTEKMDWQNGDILTLRRPATTALSGSISSLTNYFRTQLHAEGGTAAIRIISQGVEVVP